MIRRDPRVQAEYAQLKTSASLDTMSDSSHRSLLAHHSFIEIVEMGEFVVLELLIDLRDNGFSWTPLFALSKITGLDAAVDLLGKGSEYVSAEECSRAWLIWGQQCHYLEREDDE